jgi:hypothetical protein
MPNPADKPIAIDLCCGMGGFTQGLLNAGYDVLAFDVVRVPGFPSDGRLVLQDVRTLHGKQFRGATLIVAAPPCQEFSRHDQPWFKNPPPPDMSIWESCIRIAREADCPLVIENVRGAKKFVGPWAMRIAGRHFWGDMPSILARIPLSEKKWRRFDPAIAHLPSSLEHWKRSYVQPEIGEAIGRHFLGETYCNIGLFA